MYSQIRCAVLEPQFNSLIYIIKIRSLLLGSRDDVSFIRNIFLFAFFGRTAEFIGQISQFAITQWEKFEWQSNKCASRG